MRTIMLVARREVVVRLQQKGFRIGFVVALVIIALAAAAPKLIGGDGETVYKIALSGAQAHPLGEALRSVAQVQGDKLELHDVTADEGEAKVHQGDWDAAVSDSGRILAKSADSAAVVLIQTAHRSLILQQNLVKAGLTDNELNTAFDVSDLSVTATNSAQNTQRQAVSSIAVVFLFTQLITFCTWVAIGVVEEKSSRVVELILSAVRPAQLLTGKLLGIGGLAVAQVAILSVVAVGVAAGVGSLTLPASLYGSLLIAFVWFVMGFAFFAALAAGLGSLVSRQEEVSGVLTPVTGLLFVSYAASFAVSASPDSGVSRWLSIIPPISAISMPARLARGGVGVLDLLLAAGLMIAVTALALLAAARLYRAAVLHTGSKLTLRRAWRGEAVAELS